jgi:indole-3-glycerol phosphate synthase
MRGRDSDILARIAGAVRQRLAQRPPATDLAVRARAATAERRRTGTRSLRGALTAPGVRVIAECKRRSPSKGWLKEPFDPIGLARAYQAGGAAALSVVTEPEFFAGEVAWIPLLRREVTVPVMQKDFLLEPRQVLDAAVLGADAVLLIARLLPGNLLGEMLAVAADLGLEALVEVHDKGDLERVLDVPAPLVGINARDLRSFRVNLAGAARLASKIPEDRVTVLESGIGGPAELATLTGRGFRRFLIGEHLVRSTDPRAALAELLSWA